MTYNLYGVTEAADIWNLSLIVIASLTLLSQAGVEQFLPYYSQEKAKSNWHAEAFTSTALYWSILWGIIFGLITILLLESTLSLYIDIKFQSFDSIKNTIISLTPQIVFYPLNFIAKIILTIKKQPIKAYAFGLIPQISILIALIFGNTINLQIQEMGLIVGGIALIQAFFSAYIARQHLNIRQYLNPITHLSIKSFIQSSFAMRSSHTIHNLLSVMIITKVLSTLPTGSISIYQYSKKFADGILSISTGPHSLRFHAEIAQQWAEGKVQLITKTQASFLKNTVPFFIIAVFICSFAIEKIMSLMGSDPESSNEIQKTFLFHSTWILIIIIESTAMSLLIIRNDFKKIITVNTIFLLTLYSTTSILIGNNSITEVIICAIFAQSISTILFLQSQVKHINSNKK